MKLATRQSSQKPAPRNLQNATNLDPADGALLQALDFRIFGSDPDIWIAILDWRSNAIQSQMGNHFQIWLATHRNPNIEISNSRTCCHCPLVSASPSVQEPGKSTHQLCKCSRLPLAMRPAASKLTWLVLGEDPAARSHRVEQFTAL